MFVHILLHLHEYLGWMIIRGTKNKNIKKKWKSFNFTGGGGGGGALRL